MEKEEMRGVRKVGREKNDVTEKIVVGGSTRRRDFDPSRKYRKDFPGRHLL